MSDNNPSTRTGREPPELPDAHQSLVRENKHGDVVEMKIYDVNDKRTAWIEGTPMEAQR